MQSEIRRYHVIEAVGKGGFGTVYRAELIGAGGFKKSVALKVLNPELADTDGLAERLRDEARMLGLLQHRAVVRVDGLLLLNGRWTVVMEFVEGVDLKRVLAEGPLPPGPALEIVQEAAGALYSAYALPLHDGQALHILHRDIKPSNIQITPAGEVKILDFGVARADFHGREAVTRSIFFGSLAYMAPERMDGIDTHQGDVYALGAVLYELLVGEPLGKTSGNKERHDAHVLQALDRLWEKTRDEDELRSLRHAAHLDWAEELIPSLMETRSPFQDDLSGSILVEQAGVATDGFQREGRGGRGLLPWLLVGGLLLAVVGILSITSGGALVAWWVSHTSGEVGRVEVVAAAPVPPDPALPAEAGARDVLAGEDAGDAMSVLAEDAPLPQVVAEVIPTSAHSSPADRGSRSSSTSTLPSSQEEPGYQPFPEPEASVEPTPRAAPAPVATPAGLTGVSGCSGESGEGMGSVVLTGDHATVRLVDGARSCAAPGAVPSGTYTIQVAFDDGSIKTNAGRITVGVGGQTRLSCKASLGRCRTVP